MKPASDRNLLFALVAYQNAYITLEQLIDAAAFWYKNPTQNIADILVEKKYLDETERFNIDGIVEDRLRRQGGIENSLSFVIENGSVPDAEDLPEEWQNKIDEITKIMGGARPAQGPGLQHVAGVNRYIFRKIIGEGGQGVVWEVEDTELNRRVALKKVKPKHASNPLFAEMLVGEARNTGRINHTGAVPIYDIGKDEDGNPYFTMQLVRGDKLSDRVQSVKYDAKSSREFLTAIRPLIRSVIDVCNTLQFAHDKYGIIHRDLKPDNIMVDRYGETIILDWGMGRVVEDKSQLDEASSILFMPLSGESGERTQAGSIKGTPGYLSPEQAQALNSQINHRTDVYLVGATLYRILVGRPPHQGKALEMVRHAAANEFTPPREINPLIPKELEAICLKAMQTRPEDRYKKTTDLAEDLENWLADDPVSVVPENALKKSERWLRRNSKGVIASLIGLTALTLALAGFSQRLWNAEAKSRNDATRASLAEIKAKESEKSKRESLKLAVSAIDDIGYNVDDTLATLAGVPGLEQKRIEILEIAIKTVKDGIEKLEQPELKIDLIRLLTRLYKLEAMPVENNTEDHTKRAVEIEAEVSRVVQDASQMQFDPIDRINLLSAKNDFNSMRMDNLFGLNKHEEAIQVINDIEKTSLELSKLDPDSDAGIIQGSRANELRGRILVKENKAEEAIHYYDKSIENLTKCLKKKLGRDPSEPFPNEITNPENELYMFVFLGSALTEKSAALASMGKTSDAEKTLLNTLEVVKNTQNIKNGQRDGRQQELTCYIYLHQLYQRSNDQVNAKKQIDNAKKLIDDNPEDSGLRERFDAWMQD